MASRNETKQKNERRQMRTTEISGMYIQYIYASFSVGKFQSIKIKSGDCLTVIDHFYSFCFISSMRTVKDFMPYAARSIEIFAKVVMG